MPRQTFLTREFFVNLSEKEARQKVVELPLHLTHVKLAAQNEKLQSAKFLYDSTEDKPTLYIEVLVLPLTNHQTKITLHGSYLNGHVFHKDQFISHTLMNFEAAIQAAVSGTLLHYQPCVTKKTSFRKMFGALGLGAAFIAAFFASKKFS